MKIEDERPICYTLVGCPIYTVLKFGHHEEKHKLGVLEFDYIEDVGELLNLDIIKDNYDFKLIGVEVQSYDTNDQSYESVQYSDIEAAKQVFIAKMARAGIFLVEPRLYIGTYYESEQ